MVISITLSGNILNQNCRGTIGISLSSKWEIYLDFVYELGFGEEGKGMKRVWREVNCLRVLRK